MQSMSKMGNMTTYDILVHHGILGQKWGVRNGPPYPLNKVNKRNYGLRASWQKRKELNERYKLNERLRREDEKRKVSHGTVSDLNRKDSSQSTSMKDDTAIVNHTGEPGYTMNCFQCVCALEMRQRGYDVEAVATNMGGTDNDYLKCFKGTEIKNFKPSKRPEDIMLEPTEDDWKKWENDNIKNFSKQLKQEGPNARGWISFSYDYVWSGHTIAWSTNASGKVSFYDPQSGKSDDSVIKTMKMSDQYYRYGRLDNCEVDDSITINVRNRK